MSQPAFANHHLLEAAQHSRDRHLSVWLEGAHVIRQRQGMHSDALRLDHRQERQDVGRRRDGWRPSSRMRPQSLQAATSRLSGVPCSGAMCPVTCRE